MAELERFIPMHVDDPDLKKVQENVRRVLDQMRDRLLAAQNLVNTVGSLYQVLAEKGVANGYAELDASGDVPLAQIPDILTGKDADTLDSQHGAFYRDAGNLNAGTLPAARFNDTSHGNRSGGSLHALVTTLVAGFMSAADKSKLDGIESGATADQTAAEILTALKTVDGAGSGLDADKLDNADWAAPPVLGSTTPNTVNASHVTVFGAAPGTPGANVIYQESIPKVWASINGTSAPASTYADLNVSSITDNGTGDYTLTFARSFASANYAVQFGAGLSGTIVNGQIRSAGKAAGSLRVIAVNSLAATVTYVDPTWLDVCIFGVQ